MIDPLTLCVRSTSVPSRPFSQATAAGLISNQFQLQRTRHRTRSPLERIELDLVIVRVQQPIDGDVTDPEFGAQRACSTAEPPAQKLEAHVAALGLTFYTGTMFPESYRNAAIIALHGSWNRSVPSGYRVMVARTEGRLVTSYEPFLDGGFLPDRDSGAPGGWAAGRAAAGRPVDVLQMPDGSILISDDAGNRLLRVSYRKAQNRTEVTIPR
jgi:hypothetical protein